MIQTIAIKYPKHFAYFLFILFYTQVIALPLQAALHVPSGNPYFINNFSETANQFKINGSKNFNVTTIDPSNIKPLPTLNKNGNVSHLPTNKPSVFFKGDIGGPGSPEASSFKAVGSDNLVNLFTGDFSYSIPLLDVGGYPVNLFYNGGVTMEQEASWVGLGWNINPGTVSRNLRGVPDDFNGEDQLIQTQNVKPNRTWGGEIGADVEIMGLKKPKLAFGKTIGYSYNNYLGPAIDFGTSISVSIPITESVKSEKSAEKTDSSSGGGGGGNINFGLSTKSSSRSGFTLSPSLNASLPLGNRSDGLGVGISTSYNSRTGIKDLNLTLGGYYKFFRPSPISFAKPSYIPTLRMPLQYSNYSGQVELGIGTFGGVRLSGTANGYYSESKIPNEWKVIKKSLVGFMYSEKALNNKDAVMDFNRLNDAEVTPNTPIISAPQYAYDVFSIQGEGTGGDIRAYRGELGFMKDNETISKDNNISIGVDLAPGGHFGGNWNIVHTPTKVGGWEDGNNTLKKTMSFQSYKPNSTFENIYFRNPSELTVTSNQQLSRVGGDRLVRFKLGGSSVNPVLESNLEQFDKKTLAVKGNLSLSNNTTLTERDKRTQVTTMFTAKEASDIGLEKSIRNYTGFDANNNIIYNEIARVDDNYRKAHHISEIDVLETSGMRYVYGLPVYNLVQKEFTFSVNNIGNPSTGIVNFDPTEPQVSSPHMSNSSKLDGYVMNQETPAYAASFLLTGLLSPDYVDVTGNGITEDDLGTAVKFDYSKSTSTHKWRTPRSNGYSAHFNEGIKSEKKDNKATITYGEREVWYLNAIESKNMIAIFKTETRLDAKGVSSEFNGNANANEDANKRLKQIDLYTKAEIKAKGINNAIPIKTVNFTYSYTLCNGTPDNPSGGGKLTLESIFFSYNGQVRSVKDRYVFNYQYNSNSAATDNPNYAYSASDRWGTYKDAVTANPIGLTNAEYPYTVSDKVKNDAFAGAWSLKRILLPSGGQMEVQYESDDYGYVQNKRACNMQNIFGLGNSTVATSNNSMYQNGLAATDNMYVYVQLTQPIVSNVVTAQKQEIYEKYLEGFNQIAFKILVNMPKGPEALTVYAQYDEYGVCSNSTNKDIIYIKLKAVDGKSPLAKSAIGFLTESLPGQAFEGYEVEPGGIVDFFGMVVTALTSIKNVFKNVDQQMRSVSKARTIQLSKSFVRLANPNKIKYGGGYRVKKVIVKDNWKKMLNPTGSSSFGYTSVYGQEYDYTTTEKIAGKEVPISSGVASYEPGIGSEENPFREIVAFSNKLPLASAQYGAIEMPMLDAFFPSPVVGYSKVTVRSINNNKNLTDTSKRLRSSIGKQVTEFYTAKDYPTFYANTLMDSKVYHYNNLLNFLYKEMIDRKVVSQGFLVETNDMHGKMKSQAAYSSSDEKTALSSSFYSYKNTGRNGFNDQVDFVNNAQSGAIVKANLGIDVELMTDVREFTVKSNGFNGQIQNDIIIPVPFIFAIFMFPIKTVTENKYRAVTCTKLINYHAIEDSVIVMDKGSVVTTKTIAYDIETGNGIVTKTANEFNDPIYNVTYPAYWGYSGTGLAYKNIGAIYTNVNFDNGRISLSPSIQNSLFESGDELYLTVVGNGAPGCSPETPSVKKIWAFDTTKNSTALTVPNKYFIFLDEKGNLFTKAGVSFKIVRSGKRNLLGLSVSSATCMSNPIQNNLLSLNNASKVVTASAMEFKEKWQVDNEVFPKFSRFYDIALCQYYEVVDCTNGKYEKTINPYLKGLVGNFKPYKNLVYYGERIEQNSNTLTRIKRNGYLSDYANYWTFNSNNNLTTSNINNKWVWNSEVSKINKYGQELETKNPLNIYTAAQYGYSKNQPVAVANNSRVNEMFADNFEDYYFNSSLNSIPQSCEKRHINLAGGIVTSNSNVNAHSGSKFLQVYNNAIFDIPLSNINDDYNLRYKLDTLKTLINPGATFSIVSSTPQSAGYNYPTEPNCNLDFTVIPQDSLYINQNTNECVGIFSQVYLSSSYIFLPQDGEFGLTLTAFADATTSASGVIFIEDLDGTIVGSASLFNSSESFTFCLSKGFYKVKIYFGAGHYTAYYCSGNNLPAIGSMRFASMFYQTECYTDITSSNSCIYTKGIGISDSLLNPVFSPFANKKMLFSGWVREQCTTPCTKLNYTDNKIQVAFNDGSATNVEILPTGAIIDGWQKVEGTFTIPATATNMQLKFVNTGTSPSYWDDIRIHPFNANMKSYVYDPLNLRLTAELDENNYATFYEYDEEGQLIRVKKETIQGVKTIKETRSAKQQGITQIVE
ncbi:hypothetical protein ACFOWM_04265 [Ferruginibacter yonginensis]|uniref:PA14 domain-containing protein n=1 Tax=Ferruginibacter yonginensis TaxID=1310416 RepID=A0ABV8QP73_9BACT